MNNFILFFYIICIFLYHNKLLSYYVYNLSSISVISLFQSENNRLKTCKIIYKPEPTIIPNQIPSIFKLS